jgi:hypothetical protein
MHVLEHRKVYAVKLKSLIILCRVFASDSVNLIRTPFVHVPVLIIPIVRFQNTLTAAATFQLFDDKGTFA